MTITNDSTTAAYRLADLVRHHSGTDTVDADGLNLIVADVAELLTENAELRQLATDPLAATRMPSRVQYEVTQAGLAALAEAATTQPEEYAP